MTLNAVPIGVAPEAFARPALTLDSIPPDTRLTRRRAAKTLTDCGIPLPEKTLSTKASRGGGPPYQRFGKIAIYTWRELVAWALGEMGEPARNASEHRTKAVASEARKIETPDCASRKTRGGLKCG